MDDKIRGVILGTAVGDAFGLPWEGLNARTVARCAPRPLKCSRLVGLGVVSDDTEHTVVLADALLSAGGELERFRQRLATGLKRWFLALPLGIGFGTLRAMARLIVGVPPDRSGANSAGNGAAMRTALLGLLVPDDRLAEWVRAATLVTHRDARAEQGALLVAQAARIGAAAGHDGKTARARELLGQHLEPDLRRNVEASLQAATQGLSGSDLAKELGVTGFVTGFVNHTVPVALFLWLRHDDFRAAIEEAVRLGGDTDSVAAITVKALTLGHGTGSALGHGVTASAARRPAGAARAAGGRSRSARAAAA